MPTRTVDRIVLRDEPPSTAGTRRSNLDGDLVPVLPFDEPPRTDSIPSSLDEPPSTPTNLTIVASARTRKPKMTTVDIPTRKRYKV
jgi:hypothetical protein